MKAVYVRWVDSTDESCWIPTGQAAGSLPKEIETLGWLIEDRPDALVVAGHRTADKDALLNTMVIPRGCVQTIFDLGDTLPTEWKEVE